MGKIASRASKNILQLMRAGKFILSMTNHIIENSSETSQIENEQENAKPPLPNDLISELSYLNWNYFW